MKRTTKISLVSIILIGIVASVVIYFSSSLTSTVSVNDAVHLELNQDILVSTEVASQIYVGEPFEYTIQVIYRPDKVRPDFRQLLRDVRFLPFEQLHRTRTRISENQTRPDQYQYTLAYSIVGINVIPGEEYALDPVAVHYLELESDQSAFSLTDPKTVSIAMYYTEEVMGIPLQALKGRAQDNSAILRFVIITGLLFFLIIAAGLTWASSRPRHHQGKSIADILREKYDLLQGQQGETREKILGYEKIILSLFRHYGNRTAKAFWTSKTEADQSRWQEHARQLKPPLQTAYANSLPLDTDLQVVENTVEEIYRDVRPSLIHERSIVLKNQEGGVRQRISRHKTQFLAGIVGLMFALVFFYLLLNPDIWLEKDVVVFNNWLDSLPERLLDQTREHELTMLDVEMLGHLSDQQRVLENLQQDNLRSSYLYNYGTLTATAYKVIMTTPPRDEEEEATEPPSFEFPLQLLENSARFYAYDEDVRRNLEIVIKLKESQKDKGSEEVEGELGPPTPGFSRDMNPLLF